MFLLESCDTPLNSLKIYWGYFSKDFLCVGYSKFPFFALWRFQCHDRDSIFYWYGVVTIGSNLIDQLGSVVPNFIALCLPCPAFPTIVYVHFAWKLPSYWCNWMTKIFQICFKMKLCTFAFVFCKGCEKTKRTLHSSERVVML